MILSIINYVLNLKQIHIGEMNTPPYLPMVNFFMKNVNRGIIQKKYKNSKGVYMLYNFLST